MFKWLPAFILTQTLYHTIHKCPIHFGLITVIINLLLTGKANYYGKHVMQNKSVVLLQENIVSKQLALYDQETTDQYVVDCKVVTV